MDETESPLLCRSEGGDSFVSGIVVPWDETVTIGGRSESFAPGGLVPMADPVPLRYEHTRSTEPPVGVAVQTLDAEAGLWAEFKMLSNDRARAAYEAVAEGLVRGFSVEFRRSRGMTGASAQGRVSDGVLRGVALTEAPVYAGAKVTQVRARVLTPRYDLWRDWLDQRAVTESEGS